ncbi:hypothetical protein [Cesiribacter andamanensis]|uniref:Uncharacterized protein n=1 Tax=Cesiribacter andamanensis AMV16 TaxID=1279009 RepID=M7N3N0_9BACT|nr:hypothetical protein [Cesiribacter andamanensis]EMR01811.1 hypothetical protein ADICEAN_03043 [Cesiribacter andamanensis AMV16]
MKHVFLLPARLRAVGWLLLVPALVLGWEVMFSDLEFTFLDVTLREKEAEEGIGGLFGPAAVENFTNELAALLLLVALFFIGFARLKIEDEYTWKLRLDALLWGVYVYYILVLLTLFMFYGEDYFTVMVLNLFTPLVIYILRFYYLLKTQ